MKNLVITLLGADRPGLVEAVAEVMAAQGGNWLESRMARLAGKFAGILRVELPAEEVATAVAALARLESRGLKILAEVSIPETPSTGQRTMELEVVGLDRPGIVRDISQLLAQHTVNVDELTTDRSSAPMSGETLFRATARLHVPAGTDVVAVRAGLERLAGHLMVEIRFADA